MAVPDNPADGQLHLDDEGTMWRARAGTWDPVEPLRRRAWDVAVLNREFAGRYVTAHNPGLGTMAGFVDRFERGVVVYDDGGSWPVTPETILAHDPVGRRDTLRALLEGGIQTGHRRLAGRLDEAAAGWQRKFDEACARGVAGGELDRVNAAQLAVQYEADLANGRVPPVTPTDLGVTGP